MTIVKTTKTTKYERECLETVWTMLSALRDSDSVVEIKNGTRYSDKDYAKVMALIESLADSEVEIVE